MYDEPKYHLKENIYRNSDKSINIFKERKSKTLRFIAVKSYNKKKQKQYDYEYKLIKQFNHPNIVKTLGAAEDNHYFYMELEYCASSDLSHCLWPNKNSNYHEKIIKTVSTELLLGLKHMHSKGIIHCNLKPSNILIDEFGNAKICDFKKAIKESEMKDLALIKKNKSALTPCYTAPELFQEEGSYSSKTDLWSLGVIMYEMAAGQVPFFDESVSKLINKINNEEVNFEKKQLRNYSFEFIDVLKKLLQKDPIARPGWGEIERMPFWDINNNEISNEYDEIIDNNDSIDLISPKKSSLSSRDLSISNLNFVSISHSRMFSGDANNNNSNIKNPLSPNNNNIQVDHNNEEDDYSSNANNENEKHDIEDTDKEFKFKGQTENNNSNYNNEQSNDDSYETGETNIDSMNTNKNNYLNFSVLNMSKIIGIDKRISKNSNIQDLTLSTTKNEELPQIRTIMIHTTDKVVKPIIGNKIIEPKAKVTTYDTKKIDMKVILRIDKIKSLIQNESTKKLEIYLLAVYRLMEKYKDNNKQELLLNILNYFETIIISKDVANKIINTSFIKLIIETMDIDNDNIRIRACCIIAYLIRYATAMNDPLECFHLCDKLEKFVYNQSNDELNKKAIASLGEYLFFVATQIETDEEDNVKNNRVSRWTISKDSINALLYGLKHQNEFVKFYSMKTIENICILTNIAKTYFTSNDLFIYAVIDIYKSNIDNPDLKSCCLSTISHFIRHEPNLLKIFLDSFEKLNEVIDKESTKNKQFIINCLLFGIVNNMKNVNYIKLDLILPSLITLLESSEPVIKYKIILVLSLAFNDNIIISKYGEKIFTIMQKLRKDKNQFYSYVKIFESFMINFCTNLYKFFINLCQNYHKNLNDIIAFLNAIVVICPYYKISYILFKNDLVESLIKLILHVKNEQVIDNAFDILKYFSENSYNIEQNIDYIIKTLFISILNLSKKVSSTYKRCPLNICANILTVMLEDDKLYSVNSEEGKTNIINSLIVSILPSIFDLLKMNDTANDALSFLALIIERNSAFIQFYRSSGIFNYILELMMDQNYYNNLNLVKIILKFVESNNTTFDDIITMNIIDKINYLIDKDNDDDISNYSEYVMEILLYLVLKINDYNKKKMYNATEENKKLFFNKINKLTKNFKLCIKLLGCDNQFMQEKACLILIFFVQNFPNYYIEATNVKIKFNSEDINYLLKGLESNCVKIHKKIIRVFTWIIEMQSDCKKVLENYISYIQIYVEKIRDTSQDPSVLEEASKFLNVELKKINNK